MFHMQAPMDFAFVFSFQSIFHGILIFSCRLGLSASEQSVLICNTDRAKKAVTIWGGGVFLKEEAGIPIR
jgi:hypothetical protein